MKFAIGGIGLFVVAALGFGIYKYNVDSRFRQIIDGIAEAERGEDIANYAVTNQRAVLARVAAPNLFLKLSQKDLDRVESSLLKILQNDDELKRAGFAIHGLHARSGRQALGTSCCLR